MSGFLGVLAASGGGAPVSALTPMSLSSIGTIGAARSGTINFFSDGRITSSVSAPDSSSVLSNWFQPTTPGIGNSYWIKFTLSSGSAWDAGLVSGAINDLSVTRLLKWSVASGGLKVASVAVVIYSDAGGANQVASGTLSVDIESTN